MRVFYTLIGLALDVFDWVGFGMIPVICDIVDLAATVLWLKVLGPVGLAAAVELIPAADILPTNIALGIYADYRAEAEK